MWYRAESAKFDMQAGTMKFENAERRMSKYANNFMYNFTYVFKQAACDNNTIWENRNIL